MTRTREDRRGRHADRKLRRVRTHRNSARPDRGNSLVEVLASIVLMAIVGTAVLASMLAAVKSGEVSNSEAETNSVLSGAIDRVTRGGWLACPATDAGGGYEARVDAAATAADVDPSTVTVILIRYWNSATASWSATNPLAGPCSASGSGITPDSTMQLVTIRATSPDGKHTKTVDAVVGNVATGGSGA